MRTKQIFSAILATLLVSVTVGCGSNTTKEIATATSVTVESTPAVTTEESVQEESVHILECLIALKYLLENEPGIALSYDLYLDQDGPDVLVFEGAMQFDRTSLRGHSVILTPIYNAESWYSTESTDAYITANYYPDEIDVPWTLIDHESDVYKSLMYEADYERLYSKAHAAVKDAVFACDPTVACDADFWRVIIPYDDHKVKILRNHDEYQITVYISDSSYSKYTINFIDVDNTVPEIVQEAPGSLADMYAIYDKVKEN